MRKRKSVMKVIFIVIVAVLIVLFIISIYHQIQLKKEAELRLPLGQLVEVDGHNMSIYVEGTGDTTLVFLSGGGTCSPILDFKSLYSLLSEQYQIAVVEKCGYGFSDVVDKDRDIDSICPHSMSGLEYCKNKNEDYNNLPAILFRAILFFIIHSKTSREVLFSAPV